MTTQKRAAADEPFAGLLSNGDSDIDNNTHNKPPFSSSLSPSFSNYIYWPQKPVNIIYPDGRIVNNNVFSAKTRTVLRYVCGTVIGGHRLPVNGEIVKKIAKTF